MSYETEWEGCPDPLYTQPPTDAEFAQRMRPVIWQLYVDDRARWDAAAKDDPLLARILADLEAEFNPPPPPPPPPKE